MAAPPLQQYSDAFQDQLAREFDAMARPCPPDILVPDCSAAKRIIVDNKRLRDQVRAISD